MRNHSSMHKNDFLNEEQKKIKEMIVNQLLKVLANTTEHHIDKFNLQTYTDLIISSFITFSREVLVTFFLQSNALEFRVKIMNNLFAEIKNQVQQRIKFELENLENAKNKIQ